MKKTYTIEGIDCANCAMKIEEKINKNKGVEEANLNFMMGKLSIIFRTLINLLIVIFLIPSFFLILIRLLANSLLRSLVDFILYILKYGFKQFNSIV